MTSSRIGAADVRRRALIGTIALLAACGVPESNASAEPGGGARLDVARALADLEYLASDSLEGRRAGTPGNALARAYLVDAFRELGLEPLGDGYTMPFPLPEDTGVNVVGLLRGTASPDRYIVVTAHYDHLGVRNGQIYNGADDNASGTSGLLALARYLRDHPPDNSIVFAALDAEEGGLRGARAFVAEPPVPLDRIALNVNLDMISRSERDELYAAGTYPYPFLEPLVDRVAATAPVTLRTGHDRPGLPPGDDWTRASDHGAFHDAGIPFLYFGVEDHPDYHRPTDTFENIDPDFYGRALETILDALLVLDRELDGIVAAHAAVGATP